MNTIIMNNSIYKEEIEKYLRRIKMEAFAVTDIKSLEYYTLSIFCFNDKFDARYFMEIDTLRENLKFTLYFSHYKEDYNVNILRDRNCVAIFINDPQVKVVETTLFSMARKHNFPVVYKNLANNDSTTQLKNFREEVFSGVNAIIGALDQKDNKDLQPGIGLDTVEITANDSPAFTGNFTNTRIINPIMKYFEYSHLPTHLQEISKPICDIAKHYDETLKDNAEKSTGLRKLLEAKDCLVRAALEK